MSRSVLQDWVTELPLREQGTLLTGIRGCDVVPKEPLTSLPRHLTAFLRYLILNPADVREVGVVGAFFTNEPVSSREGWRASEIGHLPLHWYTHVMHAYEVCGYRHPWAVPRAEAFGVYRQLATSLHLPIESAAEMIERLSEDRIATGTVVS